MSLLCLTDASLQFNDVLVSISMERLARTVRELYVKWQLTERSNWYTRIGTAFESWLDHTTYDISVFTPRFPVILNHSATVTWDRNRILTMAILVLVGGSARRPEHEIMAKLYKMLLNIQDTKQNYLFLLFFRTEMFLLCAVLFVETGV